MLGAACAVCCAPPLLGALGVGAGLGAVAAVTVGVGLAVAVLVAGAGWAVAAVRRRRPRCDAASVVPVELGATRSTTVEVGAPE
jgi:hypothetical protein